MWIMTALLALTLAAPPSFAQRRKENSDSLVTLISAKSAQIMEIGGQSYRKVVGPARFLHNDTYLLCDTALWNVNTNIIDAIGHVRIIQDRTTLRSETLQYVVDENMAKFRGSLVQLEDKDKNTLRTHYLDYNTKDSVAIFQNGASMKDKDGQIIESLYGTYDAKAHQFVFNDKVNMYSDTTFVKTSRLEYRSDQNVAYFGYGTDMWQDDNMLSANDGWYDRVKELFFFRRNVHILTPDQEVWSDSLYYHRAVNDVTFLGNVEAMDTTRNVFTLSGRLDYCDSLSQIKLTRDPAIVAFSDENGRKDTTWVAGDSLYYRTFFMFQLPETFAADSDKRLQDVSGDPVQEYRRKAAAAAAKAAEEAAKNDPNNPDNYKNMGAGPKGGGAPVDHAAVAAPPPAEESPAAANPEARPSEPAPADTLAVPADTLVVPADTLVVPADTLAVPADTLALPALPEPETTAEEPEAAPETEEPEPAPETEEPEPAPSDTTFTAPSDTTAALPPIDSTKVSMIWGTGKIRVFRDDLQMSGDSLAFNDRDSLIRLYKDPLLFNEGNRQYSADSIYAVVKNQQVRKAHLISNAFITTQEDEVSFDQIKGVEMVAYFDSTAASTLTLTRFDALGGASALFFLQENDALATVNTVESKMLYAVFDEGNLDKIYYFENAKNNAYPVVQMAEDEKRLKGFRWDPERRPKSPSDITTRLPKPTERVEYLARPHAEFTQTNTYFPGYIKSVYKEIALRDSLEVVRAREKRRIADSLKMAESVMDSLAAPVDSLLQQDSLITSSPVADSLETSLPAVRDSLSGVASPANTLTAPAPKELTKEDLKAAEKQRKAEEKARKAEERARKKAERQAALEAKWAEQDRIYEEKQAAKAEKALQKERAKKLKALRRLERKAQRERAIFEKYLEKERRKAAKPLRKAKGS